MKKLVLFLVVGFFSCDLAEELNFESTFEIKYWVDARLGQCPNQLINECLRIKMGNTFDPDAPWTTIEYPIKDFEYTLGYIYELLVRVNTYPQPQNTGSFIQHTLIRIISKTEVQSSDQRKVNFMWIDHKTKDCVGVGPRNCLLVQHGETINENKWELFYSSIQGLQPEVGFRYRIKYFTEIIANSATDASSIQYYLIKVLSKERFP
ncbi:MAG: DUF4377 domain-containing protein [Flavobacteriaceae bacterium]|nr:DUF4377 domain-containing protein [Flavobacteriaceae bacterium]